MPAYYDYILAAIPLALLGVSTLLWLTGISLGTSAILAGVIPIGLIGHAMFVNGPVDTINTDAATEKASQLVTGAMDD